MSAKTCAACGNPVQGNYAIHLYSDMTGPEVPLCDACGQDETPTCDELWVQIHERIARSVNSAGGQS